MSANRSSLSIPDRGFTVLSGGQTGVDRAALDAALSLRIPVAGWCPRERRSEGGRIPDEYPLTETESSNYSVRTERNVRDSDGTLIIALDTVSGGTGLTIKLARQHAKPLLVIRLLKVLKPDAGENPVIHRVRSVVDWMSARKIRVLNVAGPRGTSDKRIYPQARQFCGEVFAALVSSPAGI